MVAASTLLLDGAEDHLIELRGPLLGAVYDSAVTGADNEQLWASLTQLLWDCTGTLKDLIMTLYRCHLCYLCALPVGPLWYVGADNVAQVGHLLWTSELLGSEGAPALDCVNSEWSCRPYLSFTVNNSAALFWLCCRRLFGKHQSWNVELWHKWSCKQHNGVVFVNAFKSGSRWHYLDREDVSSRHCIFNVCIKAW